MGDFFEFFAFVTFCMFSFSFLVVVIVLIFQPYKHTRRERAKDIIIHLLLATVFAQLATHMYLF